MQSAFFTFHFFLVPRHYEVNTHCYFDRSWSRTAQVDFRPLIESWVQYPCRTSFRNSPSPCGVTVILFFVEVPTSSQRTERGLGNHRLMWQYKVQKECGVRGNTGDKQTSGRRESYLGWKGVSYGNLSHLVLLTVMSGSPELFELFDPFEQVYLNRRTIDRHLNVSIQLERDGVQRVDILIPTSVPTEQSDNTRRLLNYVSFRNIVILCYF